MSRTTHFNLHQPGQDDFYDVDQFNENASIIDRVLHDLDTGKGKRTKALAVTFSQSGIFIPEEHGLAGAMVDVYMVGGGGGGGTSMFSGGGGGGYCKLLQDIVLNDTSYTITIGTGGAAGQDGGGTTAFGETAPGGKTSGIPGDTLETAFTRGGDGGSGGGGGMHTYNSNGTAISTTAGAGGAFGSGGDKAGGTGGGNSLYCPVNPYDGIAYGCGGGGAGATYGAGARGGGAGGAGQFSLSVKADPDGTLGGGGGGGYSHSGASVSISGGNGGPGGGGGGGLRGVGGDGIVYIYG